MNVLNEDEVSLDTTVTFGKDREIPFVSKTPIIRSAMSDGALSPEAVRAFSIAGANSGSATAPLELMESAGLTTNNAIITMSMGADAIGIARGFMMSGGCIRARMCSGFGSHKCPVGMATQDEKKRTSYLVVKQGGKIEHYHKNLMKSMKVVMAVMGIEYISKLNRSHLTYKNQNGETFFDVDKYFHKRLHI
jgi:glutamate synthase domain-containing protein 2